MILQHSWQRAWSALGAPPPPGLFDELVGCYRQPHRHYHTLQHLAECIERLQEAPALAEHPDEVEIALWFHDAVYEPGRKDNERQSASWAQRALQAAAVPAEACARVVALVMATQHSAQPQTPDEALLVDVDLAILGCAPGRFREYEQQVREEYRWVPDALFRSRRQTLLQGFLARPNLYSTRHFRDRYEAQARENLGRSIR